MVICLERGADLHMPQLMPLPLTVSCFSQIQIGFTFLVPAHPGRPGKRAVKQVCVCVCYQYVICLQCYGSVSWVVGRASGLAVVNQCTKFEVSRFTRYKTMNGGAKYRIWGGLGWLEGTQGHGQCHHLIERIRLPIRL